MTCMEVVVKNTSGNDDYVMVSVRIDNLGKGASGACVQCLNLGFGVDEGEGLTA